MQSIKASMSSCITELSKPNSHDLCRPAALQVVICWHGAARASCSARTAECRGRQQGCPQQGQGRSVSELHPEIGIWTDTVQRSPSKSTVMRQVPGQARKPSRRFKSESRRSETGTRQSCCYPVVMSGASRKASA